MNKITQVSITSLVFGSIILGQHRGQWYPVRCLKKNRAGISIEWMEGPLEGHTYFKSNESLFNTTNFKKLSDE